MRGAEPGTLTRGLRRVGRLLLDAPRALAWFLTAAWGLLIWRLSARQVPVPSGSGSFWEVFYNLAHAPLFGFLTLFLAAALLREPGGGWPRPHPARIALVLAGVLAYAVLDEMHQGVTPGRDCSAWDVLTDMVGAVLVLWIAYALERSDLRERALLARLGAGILLCVTSAVLASIR